MDCLFENQVLQQKNSLIKHTEVRLLRPVFLFLDNSAVLCDIQSIVEQLN